MCIFIFLYKLENKIIPYERTAENISKSSVRSDLVIPTESTLLNRPELLSQINKCFKKQTGIQVTALVGIGGAGKTTLARQYAQQQKGQVVWEINADTKAHLNASFENLAKLLSQTDKEKKEVRVIHDIKDPQERGERLIQFVKTHLKLIPHWFLIFDNVEKLADIQNYFPRDTHTWGTGKIILTSQDHNLQNSTQIDYVLFIGELNEEQKFNLFSKIMNHGNPKPFSHANIEETRQFLNKLPPFPLDVSMAAYYLKVANISYLEYLENLKKYSDNFHVVQNNILKEVGGYNKTRYGIITLSLKKIISHSQDFSDLLLFISLLSHQYIPRDLLEKYKNNTVLDSFILYLKKYSLIVGEDLPSPTPYSSVSLHNSVQNISFSYLADHLALTKGSHIIEKITKTLGDYIDGVIEEENFPTMQRMAGHLEKFLSHSNLLTDNSKRLLESKIGCIYYYINNKNYKNLIKDNLEILIKKLDHKNPEGNLKIARTLLQIGAVYTELRFYKEAQGLFENVINIYEKEKLKNYVELSWAFSHLGNVYRRLGNYEKAKYYFEKSIHLHKHHDGSTKRLARTLAYLGSVYRGLGDYQKSIDILKESLSLYQESDFTDHYRVGWILMQLGSAFCKLNNYGKAEDYLKKSLKIHEKYFDENHIRRGWVLFNLANTHKSMGNHEKASLLFDKVLEIYSKNCSEENLESARLLRDMAKIYFNKDRLNDAEKLTKKSLKILLFYKHVDAYKSLETLGEIYLKKSTLPLYAKNTQESQSLKNEAVNVFNQALKIIKPCFPKKSHHIQRLSFKIKNSLKIKS